MKATEKLSNALKKLHGLNAKKKTQYLAVLLVVAIILVIYFSSLDTGGAKKTDDKAEAGAPAETISSDTEMEDRLKRVLSKVDGVGDVDVIINYESTAERVPAFSEDRQVSKSDSQDTSSETTSEKSDIATVQGNGASEALIVKENQPEVRGVIVVAQGAEDISVRMNLLNAVTTLLNVSADKVEILKMNQQDMEVYR
ncbi:MAG: hypothetical protein KHW46_02265 [Clostridiales bacterium]|nr:hypothetical protein [Clostridiales bacterium]